MKNTIDYYNENAEKFCSTTEELEFHQMQDRFLKYLNKGDCILDFGCGSGRDTKYFLKKGFKVEAIDGSIEMCKHASNLCGIEVKHLYFNELEEYEKYNGVWACSSILHLDTERLHDCFDRIYKSLKPGGYFYTSFKYGKYEGDRNQRFFNDMDEEKMESFLVQHTNFTIIEQWITGDARVGRENEKWLNIILQKNS